MKKLIIISILLGFNFSHAKIVNSLDCKVIYDAVKGNKVVEKSVDFEVISESKKKGDALLKAITSRFEAYINIRDGKIFALNMTAVPSDNDTFNFGEVIDTATGEVADYSATEYRKVKKDHGMDRITDAEVFCKKTLVHMDVPISI